MWWRSAKTKTLFAGILAQAIVRQSLGMAPRANGGCHPERAGQEDEACRAFSHSVRFPSGSGLPERAYADYHLTVSR
jgi:hypothetical protein